MILNGPSPSRCCGVETVIVRSTQGGFVTQNCRHCGGRDSVSHREFLVLDVSATCPCCEVPMAKEIFAENYNNYGFSCFCGSRTFLAELLPWYYEVEPARAVE